MENKKRKPPRGDVNVEAGCEITPKEKDDKDKKKTCDDKFESDNLCE